MADGQTSCPSSVSQRPKGRPDAPCDMLPVPRRSLRWSNGQTKGGFTRLELLKRLMYGRAQDGQLRQQHATRRGHVGW
jgi:hypothetical protein